MQHTMPTELCWLTYATLLTAMMWVPYILNRLATRGVFAALSDTKAETLNTPTEWAQRAIRAHVNSVENLIIFAPAVLVANAIGLSTPVTQMAAAVYFFARLVHYVVYVMGVPVVRTLAFAAGWAAQVAILATIITSM